MLKAFWNLLVTLFAILGCYMTIWSIWMAYPPIRIFVTIIAMLLWLVVLIVVRQVLFINTKRIY